MFKKIMAVMVFLSLATLTQGSFLATHSGEVEWRGSLAQGYKFGEDPQTFQFVTDCDEDGYYGGIVQQTVFSSMLLGAFTPRAKEEKVRGVSYYVTEEKTTIPTDKIYFTDGPYSVGVVANRPLLFGMDSGQYSGVVGTVVYWHEIVNYMIDELVDNGEVSAGAGEQLKATVEDPFWPLFGPESISLSYTNYYRMLGSMQGIFDFIDIGQNATTRRYDREQKEKIAAYNSGFSAGKAEGGGSGGYVPGTPDFIALINSVYTMGRVAGYHDGYNEGAPWYERARTGMYYHLINRSGLQGVVPASFKSLSYTAVKKTVKNSNKTTSVNIVTTYKVDGKKVLEKSEPATPTSPKSVSFTLARSIAKKTGYATDTITYKATGLTEFVEGDGAPYNYFDQSDNEWKNWLSFATTGSFWSDHHVIAGSNSSVNKGTLPKSYSVTVGKPNVKTGEQDVTIIIKETSDYVPDFFSAKG